MLLIDPMYEIIRASGDYPKFDEEFQKIEHFKHTYKKHTARSDAFRLSKYLKVKGREQIYHSMFYRDY